jgi:16S rRNA (cytosine967-C5)-methyltransferase
MKAPRHALAPTARTVAADVLVRVEADRAFAAAALEAELARTVQLDPRDRALATELVYGVLRVAPYLEAEIARYAKRGIHKLDPHVRAHLLVAAYQLFFLSRVPAFAAVNAAVDAVRAVRGREVSAFANAVLRKVAADAAAQPRALADALLASTPEWLSRALVRALGDEGARAFLRSGAEPPPVALRVTDPITRDVWIERLREVAPQASFRAGSLSPCAIVARGAGRLLDLPGYAEGAWTLQEEGSQVVALALGARPAEAVLDACAGRGNKTALLARAVGPSGAVDAADLHASKLERLTRELARVGHAARATFATDWSVGAGEASGPYDRVLVDAPCSGIGTLRRRPELVSKRSLDKLAELAALQVAIVKHAATVLRPGGTLVYAVCSVVAEEAEDVITRVLEAVPSLERAPFDAPELDLASIVSARFDLAEGAEAARAAHAATAPSPASGAVGTTAFRLLPHVHGTDGYFVACLRRRA